MRRKQMPVVVTVPFANVQVMLWHEMQRRAPDLMRKSIIVVDCLADGAEFIVEKVSGASARPAALMRLSHLDIHDTHTVNICICICMYIYLCGCGYIYIYIYVYIYR